MNAAVIVMRRELRSYFASPIAYVFGALFLVVQLWLSTVSALRQGSVASMQVFFQYCLPWTFMVFVSALSMRLWAEERKLGTLELLMTFPVRVRELIAGKFLAVLVYLGIVLLLTLAFPLTLAAFADLDWGPVLCAYAASLLLAGSFAAVGMFFSSMTRDQIVALLCTLVTLLVLLLAGMPAVTELLSAALPRWLVEAFASLSPYPYFGSIARGVLDTGDLVYYACFTGFFLYLNGLVLQEQPHGQQVRILDWRGVWTGVALVTSTYVLGSAFHWLTGYGRFTDLRLPQHVASVAGFALAARLARNRFLLHMTLVVAISYLLAGVYEELWRRVFVGHGYMWSYHWWTSQWWLIAAIVGSAGGSRDRRVGLILLAVVAGQIVFLGNRHKARIDCTADGLYTLTSSTQRVLDGLQDRLLIECYFTRDDKLPGSLQDQRREMKSVLDEYVRRGNGRVALQYLDPQSDTLLKQKAERLQIQAQRVESVETSELKVQEIWQGVRLRYGADKQEVLPVLPFAQSTFQYEATLTPRIKDLIQAKKPKVKVLAPVAQQRGQGPAKTYNLFREWLRSRFDITDLDLSEGKLVPDDTEILLLFRPKELTDRQKYAVDQFLMRGGRLVVFADTADVEIGNQDHRSYWAQSVEYDAKEAGLKFLDQLAHYGVRVEDRVVADLAPNTNEGLGRVQVTMMGQGVQPIPYPYFVHALGVDWGSEAEVRKLAASRQGNSVDEEKLALYKAAGFKPGILGDHPVTLKQQFGPGFFWPCPVQLAEPLPAGVQGQTVLRTSPAVLVERAPNDMNPFGRQPDNPREVMMALNKFQNDLLGRAASEPRRQVGLMVALEGAFPSFFAGKPIPPRKPPEAKVDTSDPLAETPDKPKNGEPPKDGEASKDAPKEGEAPKEGDKPQEPIGPKPAAPAGQETDKDADPEPLTVAKEGAQLVVLGDADFLRDDYVGGAYMQPGRAMTVGPVSVQQTDYRVPLFVAALLDWLVQDTDLVALRTKVGTDRSLKFAQQDTVGNESVEAFTQRVQAKTARLQWANVLGPAAFLLALWAVVAVRRRGRKLAFLRGVGA